MRRNQEPAYHDAVVDMSSYFTDIPPGLVKCQVCGETINLFEAVNWRRFLRADGNGVTLYCRRCSEMGIHRNPLRELTRKVRDEWLRFEDQEEIEASIASFDETAPRGFVKCVDCGVIGRSGQMTMLELHEPEGGGEPVFACPDCAGL